jgi:predicted CoA-binding protein
MSKNISPIWFLKEPIDPEHKEYILLDYLKEISKELSKENCYSIMKEISKIVKVLNDFRRDNKLSEYAIKLLKIGEQIRI